jgi:hypothetical protein
MVDLKANQNKESAPGSTPANMHTNTVVSFGIPCRRPPIGRRGCQLRVNDYLQSRSRILSSDRIDAICGMRNEIIRRDDITSKSVDENFHHCVIYLGISRISGIWEATDRFQLGRHG